MKRIFLLFTFFLVYSLNAQVLTWNPVFPHQDGSIEVIYNSAEGNGELANTYPVYFHTGVITSESSSPSDWKHVQTEWGSSNSDYQMESLSNGIWRLVIDNINSYYGINQNEKVLKLAFVFRNSSGSVVGRAEDGGDMFIPVYEHGLNVAILKPSKNISLVKMNETVNILAVSSDSKNLSLYINDSLITSTTNDSISLSVNANIPGKNIIIAFAEDTLGNSVADTSIFTTHSQPIVANPPAGIIPGINYVDSNSVVLMLTAPNKEFVYVIGDFNKWEIDADYNMNKSTDGNNWWLTISGLQAKKEYAFQYYVDAKIRVADPFTDKVLDPWNDGYISDVTYPNLISYPSGFTSEAVSVLQTNQEEYQWTDQNFEAVPSKKMVVYELLVRDFVKSHNYQTLIDTLSYLENLGVTAIELMPVMEFEGNESWGYNPSFLFAPDKYYGTKTALKNFVNECHSRGIAVILDVVINHAFGQSPFVRLYASGNYGPPTVENPWLNVEAKHPFNVGYDFNHESDYTKYLVDRVNRYWVEEFHADGFRYDLSKGFTQKYSGTDVGLWGQYDASRIAILERMADSIWVKYPKTKLILEHFADNSEEKVLANYGFLLWGNMNHEYLEAAMGYSSDFNWASYKTRGWNNPNVLAYMESHDEERMMYKNLKYGNGSGDYSTKDLSTALNRVKLASAFFYTIPGPKMLWQFGELGYDYSIDYNGRVGNKPIRWDYFLDSERKNLYKTIAALIKLREYETFNTDNFSLSVGGYQKRINLYSAEMDATVIGNFQVVAKTVTPNFSSTGYWYDYFSGDSLWIDDKTKPLLLNPGEFHIFTNVKLSTPEPGIVSSISKNESVIPETFKLGTNYPNPFNPSTVINFSITKTSKINLAVFNILGKKVATLVNKQLESGSYNYKFNAAGLSSGVYFYRLTSIEGSLIKKMLLIK